MEKPPTAAVLLEQAERVRRRVLRQGPRDWMVQAGWALWVLVLIPPFDVVRGDIWGPIVLLSSAIGTAITFRYYATRLRRVRPLEASRWRVWVLWSIWYLSWVVFAELLGGQLAFAWTLAAVAAAAPLLAYSWRDRRRSLMV